MTGDSRNAALENAIMPRTRDLGDGFEVRRALPSAQRRMVGPFVFFDQMGPVVLGKGRGLDVRPHPHIGLATVTYIYRGEVHHRDSLGTSQIIAPGPSTGWSRGGGSPIPNARLPSFWDTAWRYMASRLGSLYRNARRTPRRGSSIIREKLCRSSRTKGLTFD
jgi:Pirin